MKFNWEEALKFAGIALSVLVGAFLYVLLLGFIATFVGPIWAIIAGVLLATVAFGALVGFTIDK